MVLSLTYIHAAIADRWQQHQDGLPNMVATSFSILMQRVSDCFDRCLFFMKNTWQGLDCSFTLSRLAKESSLTTPQLERVERIKRMINAPFLRLEQSFTLHTLHHEMMKMTQEVSLDDRMKSCWQHFLSKLDGLYLTYPGGDRRRISCQQLKEVSSGRQMVSSNPAYAPAKIDDDTIEQLIDLERECFTVSLRYSKDEFKYVLSRRGSFCFLVRQNTSQEIVGFLWGQKSISQSRGIYLHICALGRRAMAASQNIGDHLMSSFVSYQKHHQLNAYLEVRESNMAAIKLYEKWGFTKVARQDRYYSLPDEAASIMCKKV
jgi:ribosomal protein S18 acetylase RimI-like enzyme